MEFGTKVIRLQVIEIKVNLNKIPGKKRCRFGYTALFVKYCIHLKITCKIIKNISTYLRVSRLNERLVVAKKIDNMLLFDRLKVSIYLKKS